MLYFTSTWVNRLISYCTIILQYFSYFTCDEVLTMNLLVCNIIMLLTEQISLKRLKQNKPIAFNSNPFLQCMAKESSGCEKMRKGRAPAISTILMQIDGIWDKRAGDDFSPRVSQSRAWIQQLWVNHRDFEGWQKQE